MSYLITVGISFYNAEKYLKDAILSVINQSCTGWRLILIDDGSTDNSLNIAYNFKDHSNITILSDGNQKGLSARLNQITELSETTYIARMDADDIMHPERLEKQLNFLRENPQVQVLGTRIIAINDKNIPYGHRGSIDIPKSAVEASKRSVFNHPTIAGKTEWFLKNKYTNDYWRLEDFDLWYRTVENSNFAILNETLLYYREINIPYLKKYLQTNRSMREFLTDKKNTIGSRLISYLIFSSLVKDFLYRIFGLINMEQFLVKRRCEKLTDNQIKEHSLIIEYAINNKQNEQR